MEWVSDGGVWLVSPSPKQCQQVVSQIEDKHLWIRLERTYPDIISLVVPEILQRPTIKELSIVYSPLTPKSVSSLSLTTNNSLKTLYLCYSSMTDKEVDILAQFLCHNKTLTQLYLSSNPEITDHSLPPLSNILSNNVLTLLSLWGTSLTSVSVQMLLNSLVDNEVLKTLKLDKKHKDVCHSFNNFEQIKSVLSFV